ncbi:Outer membrane protein assembly factor BamB [Planctomycetales bacterium 10988]|nr:Outer membrane protein assembly factor BamB [Planctomycetales bacterium 10988]
MLVTDCWKKSLSWGVTCALLLGGIVEIASADWPHWRGPEQDGVSRETDLPDSWSLESGENVLWTSDIGGRAAPIILNNRVFLNCRTADEVGDPATKIHAQEQVVCWDAETGDLLWKDRFNVFQTDIPAPRVGWASMCGDTETGYVYMHSVAGIFRCYDQDGNVIWEHSLAEEYGKISGYGGRTQTPIIDEDRVIISFMCMNWGETKSPPPKQTYYAFDKKDGRLLWVSAPGGAPYDTNYSVPIVRVINGTRMLIGGNSDGGVYGINARTGEPIWGYRISRRGLNASPVVDGNYVYIASGEDNIDNVAFGRIQCLDVTVGTGDLTEHPDASVWRIDGIKAGFTSPLVKDGILYMVSDTGMLYAIDGQKGHVLWSHKIGTVGKGSPVWADGKLYVMEVNGGIHILKPNREGVEVLSKNVLSAQVGKGLDEIYASPAISDGRVVFVTRDRTICIGKENWNAKENQGEVPPMEKETAAQDEIAMVQLVPYEASVQGGESINYELLCYDSNGRLIKKVKPELKPQADLASVKVKGTKLITPKKPETNLAGHVTAEFEGMSATSRVRVYAPLPWKWDFTGYEEKAVPGTWVRAFLALQPEELDGDTVMKSSAGKGRPSTYIWLGPSEMSGYTIQSDVMGRDERFRMPSIGITCQRYNLILKGNNSSLTIQSWAPHLRMAVEDRYNWEPDIWYTMKMKVEVHGEEAKIYGKVWPRDEEEPKGWTITATDPHANKEGSPGLYNYSLADCYYDNVIITKSEK